MEGVQTERTLSLLYPSSWRSGMNPGKKLQIPHCLTVIRLCNAGRPSVYLA